MTLQETLNQGRERLRSAGIEEFQLDAWYLFEEIFQMNRTEYFLKQDQPAKEELLGKFRDWIGLRASRLPLQHITGKQEFMGLEFTVNSHVLIPRQDTEILVEKTMELMRPEMEILDLCTGSGCIIISLLALTQCKDVKGTAVDLSADALAVARGNAEKHHVDVSFLEGDLFAPVKGTFDLIVSNPPYIRTDVIPTLMEEVREHEPYMALDGTGDGLFFYRSIISESHKYLKPGGMLLFEIGYDQGESVSLLMESEGFQNIQVIKDLAGADRVVIGKEQSYV